MNEIIKQYIAQIYEVEKTLFIEKDFKTKLYGKIDELNNWERITYLNEWEDKEELHELWEDAENETYSLFIDFIFPIIIVLSFFVGGYLVAKNVWEWWTIFSIGFGLVTGFCSLFITTALHDWRHDKTRVVYERLQNEVNSDIAERNRETEEIVQKKIDLIKVEINEINKSIGETEKVLEMYYDINYIYPKYRNLAAISSIAEYLQSGRCDTLEGPNGAYNIYESEMRLGIIISKLDQVISKLDQIQSNQYMLYSAIEEANNNTCRLMDSVNYSIDLLTDINRASEIAQFNSKIVADNSQYMSSLMTYSLISKM